MSKKHIEFEDIDKYDDDFFDEEKSPLECLIMFKESLGYIRDMEPSDFKKLVNEWIDDNVYNCI